MPADLTPADRRALRKIADRVTRLEAGQRRSGRTAQERYRSLEGGSQEVYDDDGNLRQIIGAQGDGSYTAVDVNGPAAPTSAAPVVTGGAGLLRVVSYGLTDTGDEWPLDFARLDVHVGAPGFTPSAGSKVAEFGLDGGAGAFVLDAGTWAVVLVAVNTSGVESDPSAEVSAEVTDPATTAGGVTTYASDDEPIGLGPDDEGARWTDTDNGNLEHRWDGFGWVPLRVGGNALEVDALNGKTITGSTLRTAATGRRVNIEAGADSGEVQMFTASSNQSDEFPGGLYSDDYVMGTDETLLLNLAGPAFAADPSVNNAYVSFSTEKRGGTYHSTARVVGDLINLGPYFGGVVKLSGAVETDKPIQITGEQWHYVGTAGEPGWQNGWSNYGATNNLRFKNTSGNMLVVAGALSVPSHVAQGDVIFRLPATHRPSGDFESMFGWMNSSGVKSCLISVMSTGEVVIYNGGNAWGGRVTFSVTVPLG